MRFLVIVVLMMIIVALFSTQNSTPVSISVLVWKFEASLAIVIFLSATGGLIFGILASFFFHLSKKGGRTAMHDARQSSQE